MKKMIEKTDKKDKKDAGVEINVVPLLLYLLRRLWVIVLVGIVTASMTFVAVKVFIHPTYRCGFTAYVNNKQAKAGSTPEYLSVSDVNAAKELVKTYSAILKSNTIMDSAKKKMELDYTVDQLKRMVSTQIQDETEIIQINVVAKSPEESYKIASAIVSVAPENMASIVEGSSMKIVEYPQVPSSIYKPDYVKYTILGFGAGALLAAVFFVILYLKNDTINDEGEVESRFSVPVLGVIPDTYSTDKGKSGYYYNYYYQQSDKKDESKAETKAEAKAETKAETKADKKAQKKAEKEAAKAKKKGGEQQGEKA